MKKLAYLYIFIFLFACSKSKEMDNAVYDVAEIEVATETFENENMLQQKLQDYYDLVTLKENYPEFNEEINNQLNTLITDSLQTNSNKKVSIKNLTLSKTEVKDPTTKELYLYFDVIDNDIAKKDSIIAVMTTKNVFIDSIKTVATKIKFKKMY